MKASSDPSDSIISVGNFLLLELMVDSLVTVIIIVLDIDSSMDDWLHHVNEEESGHCWEHESRPVS